MDEIIIKDLKTGSIIAESDYHLIKLDISKEKITFITGQEMKYNELKGQINTPGVTLIREKLELKEIQHDDPFIIVQEKCMEASKIFKEGLILVEDASLNFKAMNNLPGPYIKWFLDGLRPAGLVKMLQGFDDKSAEAVCIYGLQFEQYMIFCRGIAPGKIVEPRGNKGWGWDSIFEETETGLTYGEMDSDMKRKYSHRARAIIALNKLISRFTGPDVFV